VKYFILGTVALFVFLGFIGYLKREPKPVQDEVAQEIPLIPPAPIVSHPMSSQVAANTVIDLSPSTMGEDLPDVDLIHRLFALDASKLPIVETVSFTSRVPWLKERPAWIADYAAHYETSRHFIARSLNRKPDYFSQKVSPGDRFNVFKKDKEIAFHLLIDLSKCRMWFYYIDKGTDERVLLKTYRVAVGKPDSQKTSGFTTPVGKYEIGDKVAIYKPGTTGFYQDKKTEMIQVFGTRWIPFEKALEGSAAPVKRLGLHGAPCTVDPATGELTEDLAKLGKQATDGCIFLAKDHMEELYSILITKPAVIEFVRDFREAKLPGHETVFPEPETVRRAS